MARSMKITRMINNAVISTITSNVRIGFMLDAGGLPVFILSLPI